MHDALVDLTVTGHGVVTRGAALQRVSRSALVHALARGELVRVLPSTYVVAGLDDDPDTLRRAAVAYAGPGAALSHLSALRAWGLPVPAGQPEHVSVAATARPRAAGPVQLHRSMRLESTSPEGTSLHSTSRDGSNLDGRRALVVERSGLPTVRLEPAVVQSWPLLRDDAQRAPAIVAIQRRMTTPSRLRDALDRAPKLAGRSAFRTLLDLLEQGCHSELEMWGYLDVFRHPALPPSRGQVPVRVNGRTVYLDRLFEAELVNVELDGRKYHSSPRDRERDLRRDAALARLGLLVVRFSHDRIVHPYEVRDELLEILQVRRRQLGAA